MTVFYEFYSLAFPSHSNVEGVGVLAQNPVCQQSHNSGGYRKPAFLFFWARKGVHWLLVMVMCLYTSTVIANTRLGA